MIQAITSAQDTFTATFKYSTDQEIANVNGSTDLIDKWNLSSDGKTLKQARHMIVTQGEFDQNYVYDTQ